MMLYSISYIDVQEIYQELLVSCQYEQLDRLDSRAWLHFSTSAISASSACSLSRT